MQKIPLLALPNQQLNAVLGEQNVTIAIYDRAGFCYIDLAVGQDYVVRGRLVNPAENLIPAGRGFTGQIMVIDMERLPEEQEPPEYSGLGSRWEAFFLTDDEAADLIARLESLA